MIKIFGLDNAQRYYLPSWFHLGMLLFSISKDEAGNCLVILVAVILATRVTWKVLLAMAWPGPGWLITRCLLVNALPHQLIQRIGVQVPNISSGKSAPLASLVPVCQPPASRRQPPADAHVANVDAANCSCRYRHCSRCHLATSTE